MKSCVHTVGFMNEMDKCAQTMNKKWCELLSSLDESNICRNDYESTLSECQEEQNDSILIIKKEVVDMSDLIDKLSGVIVSQHKKILL